MDVKFLNETRPTRLSHISMNETRLRRDLTRNFGRDRDENESLGVFFYETETRLCLIFMNEMRPRRDLTSNFGRD